MFIEKMGLTLFYLTFNPIQDGGGGQKGPPY